MTGQNVFSHVNLAAQDQPDGPVVFISHRAHDIDAALALGRLIKSCDVHIWLDEENSEVQSAAAAGFFGSQALVYAIERGINHSTALLGLISQNLEGSWWVPYEIGFAKRGACAPNFLMLRSEDPELSIPEYISNEPIYWSADEVIRWCERLKENDLHSEPPGHVHSDVEIVSAFLPTDPPEPDLKELLGNAINAIDLLEDGRAVEALRLTSRSFDWLPTNGGIIRDIAYDLFAPLAYYQFQMRSGARDASMLEAVYEVPTRHEDLARIDPALPYNPSPAGWRALRYENEPVHWMQGLRRDQLAERLDTFLMVRTRNCGLRLATKDEFKFEFDRLVNAHGSDGLRRKLGVLVNPLMGYAPEKRPVFRRSLLSQREILSKLLSDL